MEKFSWKGHGAMLAANCIWGLMAPVAKIVMAGSIITPLVLTDLRVFGAMVLFWVASLFMKPEKVEPKDMVRLFVASLLAIVFNQGLYVFGVSLTSPADASIITTSMPLWAMILAAFFLKEPITGKKVGGIAFGAGGALLLILGGSHAAAAASGSTTNVGGDLLILFAQLSYASYLVLFKNFVSKYSIFTIMKWMFTYAFICLLPLPLLCPGSRRAEGPAAHCRRHVQLHSAHRFRHSLHLPRPGHFQLPESPRRTAHLHRSLAGLSQQEPGTDGAGTIVTVRHTYRTTICQRIIASLVNQAWSCPTMPFSYNRMRRKSSY